MITGTYINTLERQKNASEKILVLFKAFLEGHPLSSCQLNEAQIAINNMAAANKAAEYHISQFDNYEKECG